MSDCTVCRFSTGVKDLGDGCSKFYCSRTDMTFIMDEEQMKEEDCYLWEGCQ